MPTNADLSARDLSVLWHPSTQMKDHASLPMLPIRCGEGGWEEGVEVAELPLRLTLEDGLLHERIEEGGRPTRVVTRVDGDKFSRFWLDTVTRV